MDKELNYQKNVEFFADMNIDYTPYNNDRQFNLKFLDGETVAFYPTTNKWVHRGKSYKGDAEKLWDWIGEMEETNRLTESAERGGR